MTNLITSGFSSIAAKAVIEAADEISLNQLKLVRQHKVRMSRATTKTLGPAWNTYELNWETGDVGNLGDLVNERVEIQQSGIYIIVIQVLFVSTASVGSRMLNLLINGMSSLYAATRHISGETTLSDVGLLSLSTGDLLTLRVYASNGIQVYGEQYSQGVTLYRIG